jgi:hypothetical protein
MITSADPSTMGFIGYGSAFAGVDDGLLCLLSRQPLEPFHHGNGP